MVFCVWLLPPAFAWMRDARVDVRALAPSISSVAGSGTGTGAEPSSSVSVLAPSLSGLRPP